MQDGGCDLRLWHSGVYIDSTDLFSRRDSSLLLRTSQLRSFLCSWLDGFYIRQKQISLCLAYPTLKKKNIQPYALLYDADFCILLRQFNMFQLLKIIINSDVYQTWKGSRCNAGLIGNSMGVSMAVDQMQISDNQSKLWASITQTSKPQTGIGIYRLSWWNWILWSADADI